MLRLHLLLAAAALLVTASFTGAVVTAPRPVNIAGLSATGCGTLPAIVSCPSGFRVWVASAFYGRDLIGAASAKTCPGGTGNTNSTTCALSSRDQAALTQRVARQCDGFVQCAPTAALAALYPNPCKGTSKYLRVEFACLDLARERPPTPAPVLPGNLYKRRPSANAGFICPKYSAGVSNATSSVAFWAAQTTAANSGPFVKLSLAFVDIDVSKLDAFVKSATGGLYGLDHVAELNLTAVNVHVPAGATVVIGRANSGFTTVRINAVNIIASNTGALDIRSKGADASGKFGPKVEIKAGNVFGPLQIMQNGLTARHPRVSVKSYVARRELTWSRLLRSPSSTR
jgi:hypothetical protein